MTAQPAGPWVVVVGMHRSGTSAVTGALGALGLQMPRPGDRMAWDESNPEHWESLSLALHDEHLLHGLGGSWDAPPDLPRHWVHSAAVLGGARSGALLAQAYPEPGPAALKDPRICLLLSHWRTVLPDPSARRPAGVAAPAGRGPVPPATRRSAAGQRTGPLGALQPVGPRGPRRGRHLRDQLRGRRGRPGRVGGRLGRLVGLPRPVRGRAPGVGHGPGRGRHRPRAPPPGRPAGGLETGPRTVRRAAAPGRPAGRSGRGPATAPRDRARGARLPGPPPWSPPDARPPAGGTAGRGGPPAVLGHPAAVGRVPA